REHPYASCVWPVTSPCGARCFTQDGDSPAAGHDQHPGCFRSIVFHGGRCPAVVYPFGAGRRLRDLRYRWLLAGCYLAGATALIWLLFPRIGTEIFPAAESGQLQLRLRAPTGTVIEKTELKALKALDVIRGVVGPENVIITTDFVGVQPASYPINTIYLFTNGPQEAVLRVALKSETPLQGEELRERLRRELRAALPDTAFSFEAPDIIGQVMSFGSPTPIEVDVQGPNMPANQAHAARVFAEMQKIPELRDLQYIQPLDYPTLDVKIDRDRAGQLGLAMADVARPLVTATSSSRFVAPNFWRDPKSGNAFQIQVQIPPHKMTTLQDVESVPVMPGGALSQDGHPLVGDLAVVKYGTAPGEVDRYNMQRVIGMTANIHGVPLGSVSGALRAAIQRAGGLATGLLLAVAVIFLLLAANFQSFRLAAAVVSTTPAVICGVLAALLLTRTTLNVQSFMGAIMAVGISVANAILLITFAETSRREGRSVAEAAAEGGRGRLRAILMTASAMIAGMVPMAIGLGEGGQQARPLGRAVIGGLLVATFATLTVLPSVYAILQKRAGTFSPSLDPDDPTSRYHEKA
ncbi:MAG: acriflavin resistance protein, partial [Acidobacteria bacterium]|nr:acriflavin resistance protein [Acidobacteriota bacterium]